MSCACTSLHTGQLAALGHWRAACRIRFLSLVHRNQDHFMRKLVFSSRGPHRMCTPIARDATEHAPVPIGGLPTESAAAAPQRPAGLSRSAHLHDRAWA